MEELNTTKSEINGIGSEEKMIRKQDVFLLIGSVVLAVVYNILFYKKELGISYPIFVLAFYGVSIVVLKDKIVFKANFGMLLTIPIIMLSFTYLFFKNEIFMFFNFLIIPVLILMQTILVTNNNVYKWFDARFIIDLLNAMFIRTLSYVFAPFRLLSKIIKRKTGSEKASVVSKVVIGLLLSVPLVVVVISLLSEADQVFGHWMKSITAIFINVNMEDFIAQLIIGLLVGTIIFSYLWGLCNDDSLQSDRNSQDNIQIKKVWDPIVVLTMLISVNLIYVIFTLIQFTYSSFPLQKVN